MIEIINYYKTNDSASRKIFEEELAKNFIDHMCEKGFQAYKLATKKYYTRTSWPNKRNEVFNYDHYEDILDDEFKEAYRASVTKIVMEMFKRLNTDSKVIWLDKSKVEVIC